MVLDMRLSAGVMEFVPDTCSVDVLKKRHNTDSIARVFDALFADNPFEAKKVARQEVGQNSVNLVMGCIFVPDSCAWVHMMTVDLEVETRRSQRTATQTGH